MSFQREDEAGARRGIHGPPRSPCGWRSAGPRARIGAEQARHELLRTIEQLETTNEELKASNEEGIAANEELQAANEELQTSKGQLQSLNEKLPQGQG